VQPAAAPKESADGGVVLVLVLVVPALLLRVQLQLELQHVQVPKAAFCGLLTLQPLPHPDTPKQKSEGGYHTIRRPCPTHGTHHQHDTEPLHGPNPSADNVSV
jgi:hypothetical protein